MSKELSMDALAKLKAQREKLNARIQKMEALEKERERKQDTRRKILIGAYYLDKARQENTMTELNHLMLGFLTRDSDKVLFGSSPSSSENTNKNKEAFVVEEFVEATI